MKYLLSIFLAVWSLVPAGAQDMPKPVDWAFQAEMVSDSTYNLTFTATIDKGWYLYAQNLEEGGPIPTTIAFDSTDGLRLVGETAESGTAVEGMDELFQMNVKKFKTQAVFTQKVIIAESTEVVSGYIEFMTCDNEKCLPPTEIPFAFSFRG